MITPSVTPARLSHDRSCAIPRFSSRRMRPTAVHQVRFALILESCYDFSSRAAKRDGISAFSNAQGLRGYFLLRADDVSSAFTRERRGVACDSFCSRRNIVLRFLRLCKEKKKKKKGRREEGAAEKSRSVTCR